MGEDELFLYLKIPELKPRRPEKELLDEKELELSITVPEITAVVSKLPEQAPPPPLPANPPRFLFFRVHLKEVVRGKEEGVAVPAALRLYAPALSRSLLIAAAAAAEVYAPFSRLPASETSEKPRRLEGEWELGVVLAGYRGVVACALLTTLSFTPSLRAVGAVRGPDAWWGVELSLKKWEQTWLNSSPSKLPEPFTPEEIDGAVEEALRLASPPPLYLLADYEREGVTVVLNDEVVGTQRFSIPLIFL